MKTRKSDKHNRPIMPDGAVPAAFYSMDDMRRKCGSATRVASRSKIYRMIAANIIPSKLPNLNAWSVVAVDEALARLARNGSQQVTNPAMLAPVMARKITTRSVHPRKTSAERRE